MTEAPGGDSSGRNIKASHLKDEGNALATAQKYEEAENKYREGLSLLEINGADTGLEEGLRLNLALCLTNKADTEVASKEELEELVALCTRVLALVPESVKAFYRRAVGRHTLARLETDSSKKKDLLTQAKRDVMEAANRDTADPKIRELNSKINQELKTLSPGEDGLKFKFGALYSDRETETAAEPAAPTVCSVCARPGHELCGKERWLHVRAQWLGVPVEKVAEEPASFEDDGTLREVIRAERRARVQKDPSAGPSWARDISGELADLSEDEREMLEECLDSVDRPYPQLLRSLPLPQAVRCAEELWMED
mmetsp:Transcript_60121/g.127364  ORF Transcript_60121/g.127364 Transcript_60121/m.127364 type:complete len:312 (+) Transcript_60121:101-1036(+)